MALNVVALNAAADAIAALISDVSLHTADPGANGINEVAGGSYGRKVPAYGAAANSVADLSPLVFDIPAGTTVSHYGLWSGATFIGSAALSASETYTGNGTYTLSSAAIDLS